MDERVTKDSRPPQNWLQRWWSPDARKAPREPAPGLAAHFWTGGPPMAHTIRDISATGLYVESQERWSPGTLIQMTLTIANSLEPPHLRSITILARAVRLGNDGVGLEFVLQKANKVGRGQPSPFGGADCKQLDQFLKRVRSSPVSLGVPRCPHGHLTALSSSIHLGESKYPWVHPARPLEGWSGNNHPVRSTLLIPPHN